MNKYAVISVRIFLFLSVFLALYYYYSFANRIFATLVNFELINQNHSTDLWMYAIQLVSFFVVFLAVPGLLIYLIWQLTKRMKTHSSLNLKTRRRGNGKKDRIIAGIDEKLLLNAYNQLQHIEKAMDTKLIKIKEEIVAELREELHITLDKKVEAEQCIGKTRFFYKSGQYEEALRECNSAIELSPSGVAHFIRGVVYHKLSRDAAAMDDLKTAAKLGYHKAQDFLTARGVSSY